MQDLGGRTGGRLRLAAMPPKGGELTPIHGIVLTAEEAADSDVFWALGRLAGDVELAFLRGALGVVVAGSLPEPWPGRFCLQVEDPVAAMRQLVMGVLDASSRIKPAGFPALVNESSLPSAELKDLQLCAARRTVIYPPTCERAAANRSIHRCRRQAA